MPVQMPIGIQKMMAKFSNLQKIQPALLGFGKILFQDMVTG